MFAFIFLSKMVTDISELANTLASPKVNNDMGVYSIMERNDLKLLARLTWLGYTSKSALELINFYKASGKLDDLIESTKAKIQLKAMKAEGVKYVPSVLSDI